MKLGDMVHSLTEAVGIPQCDACKERQKKLNEVSAWLTKVFGKKGAEDGVDTGKQHGPG